MLKTHQQFQLYPSVKKKEQILSISEYQKWVNFLWRQILQDYNDMKSTHRNNIGSTLRDPKFDKNLRITLAYTYVIISGASICVTSPTSCVISKKNWLLLDPDPDTTSMN